MIEAPLLARVPGCETGQPPLQVQPLSGGRGCNTVLRIDTHAGRFVLRRRHSPRDRPGSLSRNELLSHRLAATIGLAPRLIDAAEDGEWLLMEFVPAETWTESLLFTAAGIDALGAQLQRLQALALPEKLPFIDAPGIARGYLRTIAARDAALAGGLVQELRAVEADSRELESMVDRATLNHGDLQAANMLGPGPVLVDWEYAQRCHPTYDVACLLAYYPALEAQRERLLAACGLNSQGDRRILSLQQRLFRRLNRLWQLAHTETG
jgi:aminoglycoside phosphotransferase (APT) family kinase protein